MDTGGLSFDLASEHRVQTGDGRGTRKDEPTA